MTEVPIALVDHANNTTTSTNKNYDTTGCFSPSSASSCFLMSTVALQRARRTK